MTTQQEALPEVPTPEDSLEPGGEGAPETDRPTPPRSHTRWIVPAVIVLALVALFWPRSPSTKDAPGGTLIDEAGRPTPLGTRMDRVTLVHFWASWCPPCVTEAPAIQRLEHDFAGEPGFSLVMVAVADELEAVKAFLGPDAASSVLYDPSWEIANRYGTDALPETYLVVDGEIAEYYVGPQNWDDPAIRDRISAALVQAR